MIDFLRGQPLILLFLVAAIGYPLGLLRIGGSSLGIAAVLFVGLAFGALDSDLKLPEIVYQLGLVLFVYTIGLSSGPGFFRSLKRKGLRNNGWRVIFVRRKHGSDLVLVDGATRLVAGDLVSLIGTPEDIRPVVAELGTPAAEQLDLDRSTLDVRRIFVSNPEVVGRRIRD